MRPATLSSSSSSIGTLMSRVEALLMAAGDVRARLANPRRLCTAEEAAHVVGEFIALEFEIQALPDADDVLRRNIVTPLTPGRPNHAFMAGLVLARWSPEGTASALLGAARLDDPWCARMARMNLSWLAPTEENGRVLTQAAFAQPAGDPTPRHVLVDALAHQRNAAMMPPIAEYLAGTDDPANRAWTLISVVALLPEPGLTLARDLDEAGGAGPLAVTATGLRAAHGDGEALDRLQRICRARADDWHTALYWLGRIPHPAALPAQIDGLRHPDPAVRADLVNNLVLVGAPEALRAVAGALNDPDGPVVDAATAHLAQLFGPTFHDRKWTWDDHGRLDAAGRATLRAEIERRVGELADGRRYLFGEPLRPHALIDLLYIGFLPSHTWVNFIATTGAAVSHSPRMDALGNLESLHDLEKWHLANVDRFEPGAWYYFGSRV